jgi:tRNA (guanine-N7-)-methyltransferase
MIMADQPKNTSNVWGCNLRKIRKLPLEELAPALLPDTPRGEVGPPIVWSELFGNDQPVEVEVGFGKGMFLMSAAASQPGVNFFGVEVVRKYQLYAATRAIRRGFSNLRLACADAGALLRDRVASASIQALHIYFPDPWWKNRHKKRRVFTPLFANTTARLLRPGGIFHIATDVEEYFQVMMAIVRPLAMFREIPPKPATEGKHDLDYLTNFERKFRRQGLPIYRAGFERTAVEWAALPIEEQNDDNEETTDSGEPAARLVE